MKPGLLAALLAAFLPLAQAAEAPATPTGRELGFREALDAILKKSTAIATEQASLDASRARAVPVRLSLFPIWSWERRHSGSLTRVPP